MVTDAVALQGWRKGWCAWGETTDPVWHHLLLQRDFYAALVRMTGKTTRQAVGQDVSTRRSVSPRCLLPGPDYENHLPCPPPTSPLHFSWYLPYLLLYKSTPCKHTQVYTATIFSVPFRDPLYCKGSSVQSWWRPVNLLLQRRSVPKVRIQHFEGAVIVSSHVLVWAPQRKSLLCDHTPIQIKTSVQSRYLMLAIIATSINLSSSISS